MSNFELNVGANWSEWTSAAKRAATESVAEARTLAAELERIQASAASAGSARGAPQSIAAAHIQAQSALDVGVGSGVYTTQQATQIRELMKLMVRDAQQGVDEGVAAARRGYTSPTVGRNAQGRFTALPAAESEAALVASASGVDLVLANKGRLAAAQRSEKIALQGAELDARNLAEEAKLQVQRLEYQRQVNRLAQQQIDEQIAQGKIGAGTRFQQFQANLASREGGAPKLPEQYSTLGQTIGSRFATTAGFAVSGLATYGGVTALRDIYKSEQDVQQAFIAIRGELTALGESGALHNVRGDIAGIAADTATAEASIAGVFPQIRGIFSTTADALVNAKDAAETAKVTGVDLQTLVGYLVPAATAFKVSFAEVTDAALGVQQSTGVGAAKTIEFLGAIAPVAHQAGLSLHDAAAIGAAALQDTSRAATNVAEDFNRIIPAIQSKASKVAEDLVIGGAPQPAVDQFTGDVAAGRTGEALKVLAVNYHLLGDAQKEAIVEDLGGTRAAKDLIATFDNQKVLLAGLANATSDAGKTQEYFTQVQKTMGFELGKLREELLQAGRAVLESGLATGFQDLLAVLSDTIAGIKEVAGVFSTLDRFTGGNAGRLLEIAAAAKALQLAFAALSSERVVALLSSLPGAGRLLGSLGVTPPAGRGAEQESGGAAAQIDGASARLAARLDTAGETLAARLEGAAAAAGVETETVAATAAAVQEAAATAAGLAAEAAATAAAVDLEVAAAKAGLTLEAGAARAAAALAAAGGFAGAEGAAGGGLAAAQVAGGEAAAAAGFLNPLLLIPAAIGVVTISVEHEVNHFRQASQAYADSLKSASDEVVKAAADKAASAGDDFRKYWAGAQTKQETAQAVALSRAQPDILAGGEALGAVQGGITLRGAGADDLRGYAGGFPSGGDIGGLYDKLANSRHISQKNIQTLVEHAQKGNLDDLHFLQRLEQDLKLDPKTKAVLDKALATADEAATAAARAPLTRQSDPATIQKQDALRKAYADLRAAQAGADPAEQAAIAQDLASGDLTAASQIGDPVLIAQATAAKAKADQQYVTAQQSAQQSWISLQKATDTAAGNRLGGAYDDVALIDAEIDAGNRNNIGVAALNALYAQKTAALAAVEATRRAEVNALIVSHDNLTKARQTAAGDTAGADQTTVDSLNAQITDAKSYAAAHPADTDAQTKVNDLQAQLIAAQAQQAKDAQAIPLAWADLLTAQATASGDAVQAARDGVTKANLVAANAKGPLETINAAIGVTTANRALQDAVNAVNASQFDVAIAAATAAGDTVEAARLGVQKAQQAAATAQGPIAQAQTQAAVIQADKTYRDSVASLADARTSVIEALAGSVGDTVAAAKAAADESKRHLDAAFAASGGKETAATDQAQADYTSKLAAVTNAQVQAQLATIDFLQAMGKITIGQEVAQINAILASGTYDVQTTRSLQEKVHSLLQQAGQNLAFNLSGITLPTLYEVHRLNQTPAGSTYTPVDQRQMNFYFNVTGATLDQVHKTVAGAIAQGGLVHSDGVPAW